MLNKRVISVVEEASILTDAVEDEDRAPMSKVKVPDLKPFGGTRRAKVLENFLWDIEIYFQAARIPETEKVSITSMYLIGDAKLWWRTRLSDDANANRDKIKMWDVLEKELKDQFLPCNTSWLVRECLRKLKHAEKKNKDSGKEKEKSGKGWKDGKFKKKNNQEITRSGNKETAQPNVDEAKKGCYLCNSDHRMRDCPKRGKLSALVAEADDDEGGSTRVNPLQLTGVPLTTLWLIGRFKSWDWLSLRTPVALRRALTCRTPLHQAEKKDSLMSAMQVKVGLRPGEQTYLAALIEIKLDVVQEVPDEVAELLQEFKDVFPHELPKKLPPRRAIDHAIEFEPGARPLA
ncbi:UNVERIFIED_CONTAM: hypothetical protein Scaly_2503200 [Sesamum calycinum]|uniref:Retrotransposon gag domain-containing protein n=1 Tax=Sesamum calycinum TaxID=2727403 RepID=A0AAW2LTC3_9LAMI